MTSTRPARTGRRPTSTHHEPFRILVGSSGDESALGALHLARALARRKSASVHALAVAAPFPHAIPTAMNVGPPPVLDEDSRRAAIETLRHQLATVRGTGAWTMRGTVGFAADSIVDAADRWPASLIVVGLGKHGLLDRLIGSETAVTIAKGAHVPVLAVPADARQLPERAVVAVDFTDASMEAAMLAAAMLGPNGRLTLMHSSQLGGHDGDPGSLGDVYAAGVRQKLSEAQEHVRRHTKRQVASVVTGADIVDELTRFAAEEHCDLIALGGSDLGHLDRFLAGSTRARVLRAAGCSVLIVPATKGRG